MTGALRVTILGCGSSGGVPRVGGDWGACDPREPRNSRSRCSLLLQRWERGGGKGDTATTVLIDTSPDLRLQLVAADVRRLDAVLYTHDHADQTHGIDDVRALALTMRRRIPVHIDVPTRTSLEQRFGYIFHGAGGYPAIMEIAEAPLVHGREVRIDGPGGPIALTPLHQDHGGSPSLGFRIGDIAYNNDVVRLPEETMAALEGLDLWIVDALRYSPHPTHAHLERTLDWVKRLRPRRTILTNLHVDMDYETLRRELPGEVEPAYDGMSIDSWT